MEELWRLLSEELCSMTVEELEAMFARVDAEIKEEEDDDWWEELMREN